MTGFTILRSEYSIQRLMLHRDLLYLQPKIIVSRASHTNHSARKAGSTIEKSYCNSHGDHTISTV